MTSELYTRCAYCHRWHPKDGDDRLWLDAESQPKDGVPSDTICPLCIDLDEVGEFEGGEES